MKYKLIAIDMDGTFLNEKHEVSEINLKAVEKAVELGVKVIVATGRSAMDITPLLHKLNFNDIFILNNGSSIYSKKLKKYIDINALTYEETKFVVDFGKSLKTNFLIWTDNEIFTYSTDPNKFTEFQKMSQRELINIENADVLKNERVHKIMFHDDEDKILEMRKNLEKTNFDFCGYAQSYVRGLDFFHKDSSKGNSVLKYAQSLDIKPEEIIAIGDSMNDLPMIQMAGLGVAMGNACEEIKNNADFITKTNAEDGVAYVIEKFILDN